MERNSMLHVVSCGLTCRASRLGHEVNDYEQSLLQGNTTVLNPETEKYFPGGSAFRGFQ